MNFEYMTIQPLPKIDQNPYKPSPNGRLTPGLNGLVIRVWDTEIDSSLPASHPQNRLRHSDFRRIMLIR